MDVVNCFNNLTFIVPKIYKQTQLLYFSVSCVRLGRDNDPQFDLTSLLWPATPDPVVIETSVLGVSSNTPGVSVLDQILPG